MVVDTDALEPAVMWLQGVRGNSSTFEADPSFKKLHKILKLWAGNQSCNMEGAQCCQDSAFLKNLFLKGGEFCVHGTLSRMALNTDKNAIFV